MTAGALESEFLARLLAFIRARLPSAADAEDLLQDVLVKLVERRSGIRDESVPAWLFAVARRAIIDRYRARPAPLPLPDGDVIPEESPPATAAAELARCLEPFLAELAADDREILRRVDGAGEKQSAIARELGVSPSTVKSRVQRARGRLLARLEDCCAIVLDRRGLPSDFERRSGAPCACDDEECARG